mmetsp:Transcript_30966/g.50093  ORF Transcript_30966/g.50093 Transcript_30966/m.50093 type:complete len:320 (-) Transcript_30966:578-1537(-)
MEQVKKLGDVFEDELHKHFEDPFRVHGGQVPFQEAYPNKGTVNDDSKVQRAYIDVGGALNKADDSVQGFADKAARFIKEAVPGQKFAIEENKYYPELRERSAKLRKQLGITDYSQSIVIDYKASFKGESFLPKSGRLYLFQDFLGFKELGDSSNRKTLLVPFVDVAKVEKTKVLLLPTSITVTTHDGHSYVFADFLRRNEAYKHLSALVANSLKKDAEVTKDSRKLTSFRQSFTEQALSELDEVVLEEVKQPMGDKEDDDHDDGDDVADASTKAVPPSSTETTADDVTKTGSPEVSTTSVPPSSTEVTADDVTKPAGSA